MFDDFGMGKTGGNGLVILLSDVRGSFIGIIIILPRQVLRQMEGLGLSRRAALAAANHSIRCTTSHGYFTIVLVPHHNLLYSTVDGLR